MTIRIFDDKKFDLYSFVSTEREAKQKVKIAQSKGYKYYRIVKQKYGWDVWVSNFTTKKVVIKRNPRKIGIGDTVSIKKEFIDAQLDDSFMYQRFSVKVIKNNLAILYHETGISVNVPIKYLQK